MQINKTYNRKSFFLWVIFLWILMGFSYGSADYIMYESYFSRTASEISVLSVEPGYIYLNWLAYKVGLTFRGFVALYSLVGLLLISSSLRRYSKCPKLTLFAYFCYPFFLDVTQLRHFMVSAIVIYAIRYLELFSIKNIFKFCICILLAATQQITAFIYLLLLLSYLPSISSLKKVCVYGSILLLFFVKTIPYTRLYLAIIGLRNAEKLYNKGMDGTQLYLYMIFFLLLILLGVIFRRKTIDYNSNDILYKVSLISLFFIPFLLIDFQFTRLFRGIILLIYVYVTNVLCSLVNFRDRRLLLVLFCLLLFAVGVRLFGPNSGYFESLTYPILNNNYLLNF